MFLYCHADSNGKKHCHGDLVFNILFLSKRTIRNTVILNSKIKTVDTFSFPAQFGPFFCHPSSGPSAKLGFWSFSVFLKQWLLIYIYSQSTHIAYSICKMFKYIAYAICNMPNYFINFRLADMVNSYILNAIYTRISICCIRYLWYIV